MKAYTLTEAGIEPFIRLDGGQIVLGELGRNRSRIALSLPQESVVDEKGLLREVPGPLHVACRANGAQLGGADISAPIRDVPSVETSLLVAVRVPAGFRGGANHYAPVQTDKPCEHRGSHVDGAHHADLGLPAPAASPFVCRRCLTGLAYDSEVAFKYRHPEEGVQYIELAEVPHEWVIARGSCAQGQAGRMGGHDELLVALPPGRAVAVNRYGRLYGSPNWVGVVNEAGDARFVAAKTTAVLAQRLGWAPTPNPWEKLGVQ